MFCGIDEAGRGSVMGPLVVGAVFCEDDKDLVALGVKDSKRLTPKARERIFSEMAGVADYTIVTVSAGEIDARRARESLNEIEMSMFAEAAGHRKVNRIYADCPDVNESGFSNRLSVLTGNVKVIGRHGADDTFPVVSAASIVAKVTRDRMVEEISQEFGVSIGSGYPSDAETMDFIEKWIKRYGVSPKHTRNSWEPVKRMLSVSANTRITDW
ncbi:MAG: ribonuclease HII [Candidatus Thermoplasmatota archaeon]|nr:ribonuclease HII [Candidatus Thermoplasmatota archaeon]